MVNVVVEDLTKSRLAQLLRDAHRRAEAAERCGKPDCAKHARVSAATYAEEKLRRAESRQALFNAGAVAVLSPTGI